jgi:nucleoside-diphosphate-sugar epimerase
MARGILLTGATGLLGRYFLRDLLACGQTVAVLLRGRAGMTAGERADELLNFACESVGRRLPRPVVLEGDLTGPGLGLGTAERRWLGTRGGAVVHSAAYVSYQPTPDGEPWETNVTGTRRLLEQCRSLGVREVHHLSTAFVCGDRRGFVREDELDCGNGSPNAYEQSKFAGEQVVRQFPGVCATVYRPSVVVGDSRTGYTSTYHHFYRFLELAVRLSTHAGTPSGGTRRRQRLPLRLPLTGEETQNLVPVDWVSQTLVALLRRPQWHGRTFHLVAHRAVRLREIKAVVEALLHLEGVRLAGPDGLPDPTPLEQRVLEQFKDYWSYLHSDLQFDSTNTRRALPDLPPPSFNRGLVERLLRFAQEDRWGRGKNPGDGPPARAAGSVCAHYLEHLLPERARHSPLVHALPAGLVLAFDVRGPGGGVWSCRRVGDCCLEVRRGLDPGAAVVYRIDVSTLDDLIKCRKTPQTAFFDGRIEIDGDVEKALKLAVLIEQFLAATQSEGGELVTEARGSGM